MVQIKAMQNATKYGKEVVTITGSTHGQQTKYRRSALVRLRQRKEKEKIGCSQHKYWLGLKRQRKDPSEGVSGLQLGVVVLTTTTTTTTTTA